jgi:hypothetical protein
VRVLPLYPAFLILPLQRTGSDPTAHRQGTGSDRQGRDQSAPAGTGRDHFSRPVIVFHVSPAFFSVCFSAI